MDLPLSGFEINHMKDPTNERYTSFSPTEEKSNNGLLPKSSTLPNGFEFVSFALPNGFELVSALPNGFELVSSTAVDSFALPNGLEHALDLPLPTLEALNNGKEFKEDNPSFSSDTLH